MCSLPRDLVGWPGGTNQGRQVSAQGTVAVFRFVPSWSAFEALSFCMFKAGWATAWNRHKSVSGGG